MEGLVRLFAVQLVADWLGRHEPLLSCLQQYAMGKLGLITLYMTLATALIQTDVESDLDLRLRRIITSSR